jgi:hypothetical protein
LMSAARSAIRERQTLDFIVIGAARSGTTSLFEYLKAVPSIVLPSNKEAPYFSHDHVYTRGWDDYVARTFPRRNPALSWGTVTPYYMAGSVYQRASTSDASNYDERTIPLRIRECMPDVRLIALLRDPVDRARSHHGLLAAEGREDRPFDEAVQELLEPNALATARRLPTATNGYVVWGEYGRILGGYFDIFSPEQILVIFTEELSQAPTSVVQRVCDFIGVGAPQVQISGRRHNVGAAGRRVKRLTPANLAGLAARNAVARAIWNLLPAQTRMQTAAAFARGNYRFNSWNRQDVPNTGRESTDAGSRSGSLAEALRKHFAGDSARLADLLQRPLPWDH